MTAQIMVKLYRARDCFVCCLKSLPKVCEKHQWCQKIFVLPHGKRVYHPVP
jgi:hypothetical protein